MRPRTSITHCNAFLIRALRQWLLAVNPENMWRNGTSKAVFEERRIRARLTLHWMCGIAPTQKKAEAQKWGWQILNSYRLGCTENLASDKLCIQWLRPHYEQQSKLRYPCKSLSSKSVKKKNANATSVSFDSLLKSSEFNFTRKTDILFKITQLLFYLGYSMSDERVTGLGQSSVPN